MPKSAIQTITKLIYIIKPQILRILVASLAALLFATDYAAAQPGPLQTITVNAAGGSLSLTAYTPFAMSYYAYHNGLRNDTLAYILTDQLTPGSIQTADRVIDITDAGAFAFRDTLGHWSGSLLTLQYGRAFLIANRHQARAINLQGYPADSVTYVFPMPAGSVRYTAPRMVSNHPVGRVGLSWSGFHWSQDMRHGGDLVIDMATGYLARRDSTAGWIGTLDSMRIGQPVLIQVNNTATFDWTYNPNRE